MIHPPLQIQKLHASSMTTWTRSWGAGHRVLDITRWSIWTLRDFTKILLTLSEHAPSVILVKGLDQDGWYVAVYAGLKLKVRLLICHHFLCVFRVPS